MFAGLLNGVIAPYGLGVVGVLSGQQDNDTTVRVFLSDIAAATAFGVRDGDVLVGWMCMGDNTPTIDIPAGLFPWTELAQLNETIGDDRSSSLAYRVIADVSAEIDSYIWTGGGSTDDWSWGIIVLRGIDNASPIDATVVTDTGTTKAPVAPDITTINDNALVVCCAHWTRGSNPIAVPSGTDLQYAENNQTFANSILATYTQETAGATGTQTFGEGGTGSDWNAMQVSLKLAS